MGDDLYRLIGIKSDKILDSHPHGLGATYTANEISQIMTLISDFDKRINQGVLNVMAYNIQYENEFKDNDKFTRENGNISITHENLLHIINRLLLYQGYTYKPQSRNAVAAARAMFEPSSSGRVAAGVAPSVRPVPLIPVLPSASPHLSSVRSGGPLVGSVPVAAGSVPVAGGPLAVASGSSGPLAVAAGSVPVAGGPLAVPVAASGTGGPIISSIPAGSVPVAGFILPPPPPPPPISPTSSRTLSGLLPISPTSSRSGSFSSVSSSSTAAAGVYGTRSPKTIRQPSSIKRQSSSSKQLIKRQSSISAPLIDKQCFDIINSIKYSTHSDLTFTTYDEYKKSNFAYYMYDNINKKYNYATDNDNSDNHIKKMYNEIYEKIQPEKQEIQESHQKIIEAFGKLPNTLVCYDLIRDIHNSILSKFNKIYINIHELEKNHNYSCGYYENIFNTILDILRNRILQLIQKEINKLYLDVLNSYSKVEDNKDDFFKKISILNEQLSYLGIQKFILKIMGKQAPNEPIYNNLKALYNNRKFNGNYTYLTGYITNYFHDKNSIGYCSEITFKINTIINDYDNLLVKSLYNLDFNTFDANDSFHAIYDDDIIFKINYNYYDVKYLSRSITQNQTYYDFIKYKTYILIKFQYIQTYLNSSANLIEMNDDNKALNNEIFKNIKKYNEIFNLFNNLNMNNLSTISKNKTVDCSEYQIPLININKLHFFRIFYYNINYKFYNKEDSINEINTKLIKYLNVIKDNKDKIKELNNVINDQILYENLLSYILNYIQNKLLDNILEIFRNIGINDTQYSNCTIIDILKSKIGSNKKDYDNLNKNINELIDLIPKIIDENKNKKYIESVIKTILPKIDKVKLKNIITIFNKFIDFNQSIKLQTNQTMIKINSFKHELKILNSSLENLKYILLSDNKKYIINKYNGAKALFGFKGGKKVSLIKTKERVVVRYEDKKYKRNVLIRKNKRYVKINNELVRI